MIKSRIKSILLYYGIKISEHLDNSNWSKEFRNWLSDIKWAYKTGGSMMESRLRELEFNQKKYFRFQTRLENIVEQTKEKKMSYYKRYQV